MEEGRLVKPVDRVMVVESREGRVLFIHVRGDINGCLSSVVGINYSKTNRQS